MLGKKEIVTILWQCVGFFGSIKGIGSSVKSYNKVTSPGYLYKGGREGE